jgi:sodium-dependent phosphate transporter
MLHGAKTAALHGTSVDIHKVVEEDEVIAAMHAHAEKFDPATERVFGYLQVFSAIAVIFAHGAGEVGFMAGPLSAIYDIYMTGELVGRRSAQATAGTRARAPSPCRFR